MGLTRNRVGQFSKPLVALGLSGFSTLVKIEYLRIFYISSTVAFKALFD